LTECILIRPYSYKCSTWINVIYVADPLELHMRITQDNIPPDRPDTPGKKKKSRPSELHDTSFDLPDTQ